MDPNQNWSSADEKFDGTYHSNVVVTHDGSCNYIPPGTLDSHLANDLTLPFHFPFQQASSRARAKSTLLGSRSMINFVNSNLDRGRKYWNLLEPIIGQAREYS